MGKIIGYHDGSTVYCTDCYNESVFDDSELCRDTEPIYEDDLVEDSDGAEIIDCDICGSPLDELDAGNDETGAYLSGERDSSLEVGGQTELPPDTESENEEESDLSGQIDIPANDLAENEIWENPK